MTNEIIFPLFTKGQYRWAEEHDWFLSTETERGYVLVKDVWFDREAGIEKDIVRVFDDFKALKYWAGY
jgi:hypothetical protein